MKRPALREADRAAVASAAAAAARQLAEDLTFPMRDRDAFEELRQELRDGFRVVIDEAFPHHEEGRPATGMAGARDDAGRRT